MSVVKNGHVLPDQWVNWPDDAGRPTRSNIIVSLGRWRREHQKLSARPLELGLALKTEDSPLDVPGDVNRFDLITIDFPVFTDGRGYTTARLLRERLGYTGELRAVGDVRRDQYAFLRRSGFDAIVGSSQQLADLWDLAPREMSFPFQAAADDRVTVPVLRRRFGTPQPDQQRRVQRLLKRYNGQDARDILEAVIHWEFPGQIALVSSFGAEAAVLLHMVSQIDPALPVLFLNTGKIFGETLRYRTQLIDRLGLQDVRDIKPSAERLAARDPGGVLWASDPEACCYLRKVEPLNKALTGFGAWITGRKRSHGGDRAGLPVVEALDGRFKINPIVGWMSEDVAKYIADYNLPSHPLEADGFSSIGCMPCTDRAGDGEDVRDGRWRGSEKTECGIHLPISTFKDYGADI